MVSLGTITGASPLDVNDTTYLTSNDQPSLQIATVALGNMPADFATMNTPLSFSVVARLRDAPPAGPDTYTLEWCIVNAAQTAHLAGASAAFEQRFGTVGTGQVTNNVDQTFSGSFNYVDTVSDKAAWDGAIIQFRFNTSAQSMGPDANAIQVDYFQITGDYDATAPSVTATPSGTGTSVLTKKLTAARAFQGYGGIGTPTLTTLRAPRVWLNSTQTLSGATRMTVTAWSDTSITFTDPAGAPTGSLFLGVENMQDGGGEANTGWIAVTVNNANNRNLVANITAAAATVTSEADALLALQSAITTGDATVTSAATVDLFINSLIIAADATLASDADVALDITSAITTGDATLDSVATLQDPPRELTAAITTADATVASAATVDLAITSAITTEDATVTSAAAVETHVTSDITTADATLASATAVDLVLTSAITTADATLEATANSQSPPAELTAAITAEDATLASAAAVGLELTSAITADDATLTSETDALLDASAAITADDATLASVAAVDLEVTSAITTADATLVSEATVADVVAFATVDITTDDATVASAAAVELELTSAIATADATVDSAAAVDLTASVGLTTDTATLESQAAVFSGAVSLTADITTDDATLVATADDQEPAQPGGGGGFGWNRKDWQKAFEDWLNPKKRRGPRRRAKIRVTTDDAGVSAKFTRAHQAARAATTIRCESAGMGSTGTVDWSGMIELEDEEFDLWFG